MGEAATSIISHSDAFWNNYDSRFEPETAPSYLPARLAVQKVSSANQSRVARIVPWLPARLTAVPLRRKNGVNLFDECARSRKRDAGLLRNLAYVYIVLRSRPVPASRSEGEPLCVNCGRKKLMLRRSKREFSSERLSLLAYIKLRIFPCAHESAWQSLKFHNLLNSSVIIAKNSRWLSCWISSGFRKKSINLNDTNIHACWLHDVVQSK